jgi:hypothetical protein
MFVLVTLLWTGAHYGQRLFLINRHSSGGAVKEGTNVSFISVHISPELCLATVIISQVHTLGQYA